MTKNPAPAVDPQVIDPPHYLTVSRYLPYDLGVAYEQVCCSQRPGSSQQAVSDLTSALWYLDDHIEHFGPNSDHQVDADAPLRRIIHAEKADLRREVYLCLLFGDIARMREAVIKLIDREDEPTAATARPAQAQLFALPGFSGLTDVDEVAV